MEKVLILRSVTCLHAKAVTRLESRPPLKNIPKGTSLMSLFLTLDSSRLSSSRQHSFCDPLNRGVRTGKSQYRFLLTFPLYQVKQHPASSFKILSKIERGSGTYSYARYCLRAWGFILFSSPGYSRMAFNSEAKTICPLIRV